MQSHPYRTIKIEDRCFRCADEFEKGVKKDKDMKAMEMMEMMEMEMEQLDLEGEEVVVMLQPAPEPVVQEEIPPSPSVAAAVAVDEGASVQGRSTLLAKLKADLKRNIIQDGHFS